MEFRTGMARRISFDKDPKIDRSAAEIFRKKCRQHLHKGSTAGIAPKHVQANVVFLPKNEAFEFLLFCLQNPVPCPLIEVTEPGNPHPKIAPSGDLRTDLPAYRVFENGKQTKIVHDISEYWRDDMVSFLLGCSFTWDEELGRAGLKPRHEVLSASIPSIYRTNIPMSFVGNFKGNTLVSMRPYKASEIEKVCRITAAYPSCHGGPIHIGNPEAIGIKADEDENMCPPDFGDEIKLEDDDIPMFWACGLSSMAVIENAKVPLAIMHDIGCLFVSDLLNFEIKVG